MNRATWNQRRERGSLWLVRLMIWTSLRLHARVAEALLWPIALYFSMASPHARAASRAFLPRALGRAVTGGDIFRHILVFSHVLLDRVFLLADQAERYRIDVEGLPDILAALARGRGCILLGSHLGSFEVLRSFARDAPVPVKVLMHRAASGPYSRLVEALAPDLETAIIPIGGPDTMLRVRESLERGEMVGILADRAPAAEKSVRVPFFGDPAPFPTGPLILAATLGVPVVLFFGVWVDARHYRVRFEPFADRIVLDRAHRVADVTYWVACYAARLEAQCRAHPFNWFNFHDFWEQTPDSPSPLPTAVHAGAARTVLSAGTGDGG